MFYRTYAPSPPLGDFIGRFWLCSDTPSHSRERIVPSGTLELVFNLRDDEIRIYDPFRFESYTRLSGAIVSGGYSRFFVIDPLQHASMLGVHFRPGGAFRFLGVPASELADRHLDLETLWGSSALDLRERLCAAATPEQRFSLLEGALGARAGLSLNRHPAVSLALEAFDVMGLMGAETRVREVARRAGLSQRRFVQVFAAEVGLRPKLYSRLRRFGRARKWVRSAPSPDWARIAVDCGYFDQSHLIRDFLAFSGFSPVDYLRHRSERVLPNHVPQVG